MKICCRYHHLKSSYQIAFPQLYLDNFRIQNLVEHAQHQLDPRLVWAGRLDQDHHAQHQLDPRLVWAGRLDQDHPGNNIRKLISITSFVLLEELWPDTTEEMTGVTNYQLLECSREMFEMVSCEQTDVLSSVNFKYSTPALRITFPHYKSQVIGLDFLGSPTIQSRDKWSSRDLNDQSFPSKEQKRLQIITFLVFSFQSAAYLVFHSNLTFWANCFLEYLQTLFARQIM